MTKVDLSLSISPIHDSFHLQVCQHLSIVVADRFDVCFGETALDIQFSRLATQIGTENYTYLIERENDGKLTGD